MKSLWNKFLPLLILFVLWNCSSRKVDISKSHEDKQRQEQIEKQQDSTAVIHTIEQSQIKILEQNIALDITPIGEWVDFSISYKGEQLKGRTNGKIHLQDTQKQEDKEELKNTTETTQKHTKEHKTIQEHTQTQNKEKHSKKKGVDWGFIVPLIGFAVLILWYLGSYVKNKI